MADKKSDKKFEVPDFDEARFVEEEHEKAQR